MTVAVTYDRDRVLSVSKKFGIVQQMTRGVRVSGLDLSQYDAEHDYWRAGLDALDEALKALDVWPGRVLEDGISNNLILVDYDAAFVDKTCADVTLVYENIFNTDFQKLGCPEHGRLFYKVHTPLEMVETQLESDGTTQITTEYTYPGTHEKKAGKTETHGGFVNVSAFGEVRTLTGIIYNVDPDVVTYGIVNFLNSTTWFGLAAGTVKCTDGSYEQLSTYANNAENAFMFTFEFTHKDGGWQPDIVFLDADSGEPPPDLIATTGYKTLTYYPLVDFNHYFDAFPDDPAFG